MRAILVLALALLVSSPASAKSYKVFKSGNWSGYAVYGSSGKFVACTILARYVSGTWVSISVSPANRWVIALKRKGGYPPNKKFFTKLYVDKSFLFSGQAVSTRTGVVRLTIPGTKRVVNALRQGRVLRLITAAGKSGYKLSGTRVAIARLVRCTIAKKGRSRSVIARRSPSSDAFGGAPAGAFSGSNSRAAALKSSAPTSRSSRAAKVPREKLLVFVSNFLARAGFTGFRILPTKTAKKAGDVVWKLPDGSLGSIKAYHSSRGFTLDRVTGAVIAGVTNSCKGDFASGKRKTSVTNGLEVRRLFASCNDTKKPFEVQYSLIKMRNGDILRMSHFRFGKARDTMDPAQMQRTEAALLRVVQQDPGVLR